MDAKGYERYVYAAYGTSTGTAKSYITAVRIIDEMFSYDDAFGMQGESIATISSAEEILRLIDFIQDQQSLFKAGKDSIFRNISPSQHSYPKNSFCLAAVKRLLDYHQYESTLREADSLFVGKAKGSAIGKGLITIFNIEKEGKDKETIVRTRLGQDYFRRMVLANYDNKCCVTGLNIPQTLRASHIVAWAESKANRMNPENGLCLSATYDAAFDRHLISFDDDYRMIVSREIQDYYTNEAAREYFAAFEGKQITMPTQFKPSKTLLAKHRELLVG